MVTLVGNAGNNFLNGSSGDDNIQGLGGDDEILGWGGRDVLDGGDGNDQIVSKGSHCTITGGAGNDIIHADGGINVIDGGTGDDRFYIDFAATATYSSRHKIYGGDGNDNVSLYTGDNNYFDGGAGNDSFGGSNSNTNTLIGGDGNDHLTISGNNNILTGDVGADNLQVIGDNTHENGGIDNDNLSANGAANLLYGEDGDDIIRLDGTGGLAVGSVGNDQVTVNATGGIGYGDDGDDIIHVSGIDNQVYGGIGNDTIYILSTGDAAIASGGVGDDTYIVGPNASIHTAPLENAGEGIDTVQAYGNYTLGANLENLVLLADSSGASGRGTGNRLDNVLTGLNGDDVLDGAVGADIMKGGAGDDSYYVDNVGDVVVEAARQGNDSVWSHVSYTLSANVENLTLQGNGNYSATGNASENILTGNDGNNLIDGQAGADTMIGGIGSDTYMVDNADDYVLEFGDTGVDTVKAAVSFTIATGVEIFLLTGTGNINGTGSDDSETITGNSGNNSLFGMGGDDVLSGGGGTDVLAGGLGDDTYIVNAAGSTIVEAVGEGTDTVLSSITLKLAANVDNLTLTGSAAIDGTGNGDGNVITGNGAINKLDGGAGNDALDGGAGADTMIGGTGDDTFWVDNAGDVVTEKAGAGTDTIHASLTWTLAGSFVENLQLTGTANINATGNSLANALIGNDGDNILAGGFGADTLTGGEGYDTFLFEKKGGADTITDYHATDSLEAHRDTIDLHAISVNVVHSEWLIQVGSDVQIDMGGGNVITVLNADTAHLNIIW